MAMQKTKAKALHAAAKEIVCRVIDVCDDEARTGELRFHLAKRQRRASDYTAVGIRTVERIMAAYRKAEAEGSKLYPPGKHLSNMTRIFHLDYFGIHVVRNIINDFYICHKGELTSTKLLVAIREKIDFPGGLHALRNLLRDMGFKWKKCRKKRYQILLENPHFILWRCSYLKSVRKAREENKHIIYLSETWVNSNFIFKKCWYSGSSERTQASIDRSNRLIMLHACNETGFIRNAQLIFKANEPTEVYGGRMNYQTYEKWLTEKLLPNIPGNCVIILDNSQYNCAEQNKMPSKYTTKASMISWLAKNGVSVSPDMNKGEIYNLLAKYKSNEKVYCIDEMLKAVGHTVLRLPPFMFDLNPLELLWVKVESKLRHNNLTTGCTPDLKLAVIEAVNSIIVEGWQRFFSDIIKIENEYSQIDEAVEVEVDKFLVNRIHHESSESTSDSEGEIA